MSFHHILMDACLWFIALLWLCGFLAKHPGPCLKDRRKLPPPSQHCQRTPDWARIHKIALVRRQAE